MTGFKTEGIILKRRDFGEADRIITVLAPYKGKLSVLAKGVRRITSRRSGNVELLNRVLIYLHQGKNFLILTEAESLDTYSKIKGDLTLSIVAFHLIELVDKLTAENQENNAVYKNLVEVLKKLEKNPRQIFIRAFEVKILSALGFMNFDSKTSDYTLGVSIQVRKTLEDLQFISWNEVEKMEIDEKQAMELERVLRYHLEKVIEGSLKSRQFLKKV